MRLQNAWGLSCLLLSICATPCNGAEMILFQLRTENVEISRQDFETLARTGQLPADVQSILGEEFQAPIIFQQLFARPIRLPTSVSQLLDSSTGEFLLQRIDTLISGTSGQTSVNLRYLKSAFIQATQDQEISLLNLIREYPQEQVRVNLNGLDRSYQDLRSFIENIQSDSNKTREVLANLLCNCPHNKADKNKATLSYQFSNEENNHCQKVNPVYPQ